MHVILCGKKIFFFNFFHIFNSILKYINLLRTVKDTFKSKSRYKLHKYIIKITIEKPFPKIVFIKWSL